MERMPQGRRRTSDCIYQPPESTLLLEYKGMEPAANLMGTGVDELQLQESLPRGKQRRETA